MRFAACPTTHRSPKTGSSATSCARCASGLASAKRTRLTRPACTGRNTAGMRPARTRRALGHPARHLHRRRRRQARQDLPQGHAEDPRRRDSEGAGRAWRRCPSCLTTTRRGSLPWVSSVMLSGSGPSRASVSIAAIYSFDSSKSVRSSRRCGPRHSVALPSAASSGPAPPTALAQAVTQRPHARVPITTEVGSVGIVIR